MFSKWQKGKSRRIEKYLFKKITNSKDGQRSCRGQRKERWWKSTLLRNEREKTKKNMEYLKETKNKQDENEIPKETYIQQIYIHANYVAWK